MFGQHEIRFCPNDTEKIANLLFKDGIAPPFVGNRVDQVKIKFRVQVDRRSGDPGFFLRFPQCRFTEGFPILAVPLGKIPAIVVSHQQELRWIFIDRHQKNACCSDWLTGFFLHDLLVAICWGSRLAVPFVVASDEEPHLEARSNMKIYTRTGDAGSTGLFGGPRVSKDDDRIESYGTVDELNAAIGMARSAGVGAVIDGQLDEIQHQLFSIGAELATPDPDARQMRIISAAHVKRLEGWIDEHDQGVPELTHFILPSGHAGAVHLHLARAICRRAERRVVTLVRRQETNISVELVIYLNRLSDLLFVMTRVVNQQAGVREVQWIRPTTGDQTAG